MEVVNGTEVEIRNGGIREDPVTFELNLNVNKMNEAFESSIATDALKGNNSVAEDSSLPAEGVNSSGDGSESATAVAPENKGSTVLKKNGLSKVQKSGEGRNGMSRIAKNPRAGLSQSLSFPAKGSLASALRKSQIIVKQTEGGSKNPANGSDVANGGVSVRHTTAARKPLPVKSGSVDHGAPSDIKSTSPHAATHWKSIGSASCFSFRLDERAEKRKEFFLKLEEKIHAKELEKTNLQEKSKESQEAEIRRLRKSLTFKATPMPSFYQEPGLPNVELKKIPPTRARSPKLGRHKPSTAAATNSSDGSILLPRADPIKSNSNGSSANSNGGLVAAKKPTQKLLTKVPSKISTAAKPEAKPISLKSKVLNQKQKTNKPKAEGNNKLTDDEPPTETSAKREADSLSELIDVASEVPEAPNDVIEVPVNG